MFTPELIAYAAKVTVEMGITEDTMTPELMKKVLKESMRRMQNATVNYIKSNDAQKVMSSKIYAEIA